MAKDTVGRVKAIRALVEIRDHFLHQSRLPDYVRYAMLEHIKAIAAYLEVEL